MPLESRFHAPDAGPDDTVVAEASEPERPPVSRGGAVAAVVAGALLLLAGADVVRWRPREPTVVAATMSEAVPLMLDMGSRYETQVPGVQRVAVSEADVVDVRVVGPETLSLEPQAPGTLTLWLWTQDGTRRTYTVTVRPR